MIKDAFNFLDSFNRCQAEDLARKKNMESPGTSTNNDYTAALKVWVEFIDTYVKVPSDYEHFSTWLLKRIERTSKQQPALPANTDA